MAIGRNGPRDTPNGKFCLTSMPRAQGSRRSSVVLGPLDAGPLRAPAIQHCTVVGSWHLLLKESRPAPTPPLLTACCHWRCPVGTACPLPTPNTLEACRPATEPSCATQPCFSKGKGGARVASDASQDIFLWGGVEVERPARGLVARQRQCRTPLHPSGGAQKTTFHGITIAFLFARYKLPAVGPSSFALCALCLHYSPDHVARRILRCEALSVWASSTVAVLAESSCGRPVCRALSFAHCAAQSH